MNIKDIQTVLTVLKELSVDENVHGWSTRLKNKNKSVKILENELKKLEHDNLKIKYGVGLLDSLSICEECGENAMVSYMSGGYRCQHCGAGEICF